MKKLICGLILSSILISSSLFADTSVSLKWSDNSPSDRALGYKVYDNLVEIDDVVESNTIVIVKDGNHSFTVTCYNVNGESIHSASQDRNYFTAAPGQPSNFLATDEITLP